MNMKLCTYILYINRLQEMLMMMIISLQLISTASVLIYDVW